MTDPATRIVSLTITEGGYLVNQATGEFDAATRRSSATSADGAVPSTAFGYVVEALRRRRAAGTEPFTVMSCDNIQGNGEVAHEMIGAFARLRDAGAGRLDRGARRRSRTRMVDRITPVTTDHDRAVLARAVRGRGRLAGGLRAVHPVGAGGQVPDRAAAVRASRRAAGADVTPYELMKLRLLNASHQAMCYLGYLAGYRYAHEVCAATRCSPASCSATWTRRRRRPSSRCRGRPRRLQAPAGRAVRQPRDQATPWPGCARRAPTGSRSGWCR